MSIVETVEKLFTKMREEFGKFDEKFDEKSKKVNKLRLLKQKE